MHTCHFLGGAGLPLSSGVVYRLGIGHDHLRVALPTGDVAFDLPYSDVIEATAYGKGQVTTTVHSFVRLVTSTGEGVFAFTESLPQQVDIELAKLRVFQRGRSTALPAVGAAPHASVPTAGLPSPPMPAERLAMLERLGQLRQTGVLSEQELETQKQLLLG